VNLCRCGDARNIRRPPLTSHQHDLSAMRRHHHEQDAPISPTLCARSTHVPAVRMRAD
jgi:hypothetical protein